MFDDSFTIHSPSFSIEDSQLKINCYYASASNSFEEKFLLNFPNSLDNVNQEALVSLIELLSIAAGTSYYKAVLTKEINFENLTSAAAAKWAQGLYDQGLREFRFTNQIPFEEIPDIIFNQLSEKTIDQKTQITKCLVPIGGGKDSATSLEILKRANAEIVGFCVGDFQPIIETAKQFSVELIKAQRTIDPRLIELNKNGAPNGHIPVTAINSVLALIAAHCIDAQCVAMSNESSADEPTRIIDGLAINHQWSKSFEAENLLRDALSSAGVNINYFSLLRGLSEFEIFSLFSTFERTHKVFTSCNKVFRIDEERRHSSWCGDCDKCRFVYLGLAAFKENTYVSSIFGEDLLEEPSQIAGFKDLLGINNSKPFECVGTIRETRSLATKVIENNPISVFAKELSNYLEGTWSDLPLKSVSKTFDNIPQQFKKEIKTLLTELYIEGAKSKISETQFGVVGLGRDTTAIIRFLNKVGYQSDFKVFLPQENLSSEQFNEVLAKHNFDSAIKISQALEPAELNDRVVFVSPGVSKYSDDIVSLGDRATTPLAWWLELNKSLLPTTGFVAITGTKGKSTSSSMISHVLSNSVLAGNVGKAVGDIDLESLVTSDFVVLEISSYQASYIKVSPHVIGVTSLFDCHIDWHRTPEKYRQDKMNVALHGAEHIVMDSSAAKQYFGTDDFPDQLQGAQLHIVDGSDLTIAKRNEMLASVLIQLAKPLTSSSELEESFKTFQPLKYRYETIATIDGVKYISDVLSTAPQAVLASVNDTLKQNNGTIYLIFGGAISEVNHDIFIEEINKLNKVVVLSVPETGHQIEAELTNTIHAKNLEEAINIARNKAVEGDVVLLAPGAPSFHAYENYEELAAHFESLVLQVG